MPKTVQIRNLDDDVYAALARQAADERISVPELLRQEATRLAARPSMAEWLARVGGRTHSNTSGRAETLATFDELRGPWPDAGR